jgi:7-cyano-7-deazaguanine synthase
MKDKPKGKKVLLFSGGMDCYMTAFLVKPDILLHVDFENGYNNSEKKSIQGLVQNRAIGWDSIKTVSMNFLSEHVREDAAIPLRNLFFLSLVALYGEDIYIGSVDGDVMSDNTAQFFGRLEGVLDYLYENQPWCEERGFSIHTPFKSLTKTELVKKYLEEGGDQKNLLVSFSCYDPVHGNPCGWCMACFRKWVALQNNGIPTENYFESNPWEAPWLRDLLHRVVHGNYRGKEDKDWMRALESVNYKF